MLTEIEANCLILWTKVIFIFVAFATGMKIAILRTMISISIK